MAEKTEKMVHLDILMESLKDPYLVVETLEENLKSEEVKKDEKWVKAVQKELEKAKELLKAREEKFAEVLELFKKTNNEISNINVTLENIRKLFLKKSDEIIKEDVVNLEKGLSTSMADLKKYQKEYVAKKTAFGNYLPKEQEIIEPLETRLDFTLFLESFEKAYIVTKGDSAYKAESEQLVKTMKETAEFFFSEQIKQIDQKMVDIDKKHTTPAPAPDPATPDKSGTPKPGSADDSHPKGDPDSGATPDDSGSASSDDSKKDMDKIKKELQPLLDEYSKACEELEDVLEEAAKIEIVKGSETKIAESSEKIEKVLTKIYGVCEKVDKKLESYRSKYEDFTEKDIDELLGQAKLPDKEKVSNTFKKLIKKTRTPDIDKIITASSIEQLNDIKLASGQLYQSTFGTNEAIEIIEEKLWTEMTKGKGAPTPTGAPSGKPDDSTPPPPVEPPKSSPKPKDEDYKKHVDEYITTIHLINNVVKNIEEMTNEENSIIAANLNDEASIKRVIQLETSIRKETNRLFELKSKLSDIDYDYFMAKGVVVSLDSEAKKVSINHVKITGDLNTFVDTHNTRIRNTYNEIKELNNKFKSATTDTERSKYKAEAELKLEYIQSLKSIISRRLLSERQNNKDFDMINYMKDHSVGDLKDLSFDSAPKPAKPTKPDEPKKDSSGFTLPDGKIVRLNIQTNEKVTRVDRDSDLIISGLTDIKLVLLKQGIKVQFKKEIIEQLKALKQKIAIEAKTADGKTVKATKAEKSPSWTIKTNNPDNIEEINIRIEEETSGMKM